MNYQHEGQLPRPSQDRDALRTLVWSYHQPEVDSENLEEALAAINSHVWRPINQLLDGQDEPHLAFVPPDVQQMFRDPMCDTMTPATPKFWLLVRALRDYVSTPEDATPLRGGGGFLPQSAVVPDMKALSEVYVDLRKIYRAKAESDLRALTQHLKRVVQRAGQENSTHFSDDEIQTFAKHAAYLVLLRGKKLKEQFEHPNEVEPRTFFCSLSSANELSFMFPVCARVHQTDSFDCLIVMVFSPEISPPTLRHHIAFLAASNFATKHGRVPGASPAFSELVQSIAPDHTQSSPAPAVGLSDGLATDDITDEQFEADKAEVVRETRALAARFQADLDDTQGVQLLDQAATEMVRAGLCSLPSTSALMGGVVAQEAIKYITHQYVPEKNTVVYSGMEQTVGVFDL